MKTMIETRVAIVSRKRLLVKVASWCFSKVRSRAG